MVLGSGVEMLKGVFCHRLDPSSSPDGTASKAIVDATGPMRKISGANKNLSRLGVTEVTYPLGDARLRVLKMAEGSDAKAVLREVVNGSGLTICVDGDIDARDLKQVFWGTATRFQPAEDIVLLEEGMGIDGTKPKGWKAKRATIPFA